MKTAKTQRAWTALRVGALFVMVVSTLGFSACGKKNSGGSAARNQPLINPANQCSGGFCFGAASGQQISKSLGRMQYDDNLDTLDEPTSQPNNNFNRRLMELSLTVNILQNVQGANTWGVGYVNPGNPVPSQMGGRDLLHVYRGPVQVHGTLSVNGQVAGCNIPVGTYQIQPASLGTVSESHIWQSVVASTPQGNVTLDLDGVQIVGMPATSMINNTAVTYDSFLYGIVTIRECNDASFRME